ncbi:MAG: alpha/beta fold hydrolase [Gammaproteobacteria bacterium]|nr:alpha/beta fold hydrolase [Gammaproteobacteria bacterium]
MNSKTKQPVATSLSGVTHHKATINGITLHWVEQGSGPLLVLFHGFAEFWWSWRSQIGPLARDFRVAAVDMRGFNESDKPASGYDTATLATDIRSLIDHLGGRAYVAAHDWEIMASCRLWRGSPPRYCAMLSAGTVAVSVLPPSYGHNRGTSPCWFITPLSMTPGFIDIDGLFTTSS